MDTIAFLIGISVILQTIYFSIRIKGVRFLDRILDKEEFYIFIKILFVLCIISLIFLVSKLIELYYDKV